MKFFCFAFGTVVLSSALMAQAGSHRTSGIYQTSADYQNGGLEFEGSCGSKVHKLELHDVLNKPYIDLTHGTQKQRLSKRNLFGFRACDGHDYRFASNLEYRILEAKEAYINVREIRTGGKGSHTISTYYFSAGPDGQLLPLTVNNLRLAYPQNQVFGENLDMSSAAHRELEQYDRVQGMFEVNYLLKASHAEEH